MAKLTPVFIDFETFWSATHTLKKMSPLTYVMHPETEIISCAVKVGYAEARTEVVFDEDEVARYVRSIDWSDKIAIAHNMEAFDSMILAWRLGVRPAMWCCTQAMARPHFAKTVGLSLGALVEHFGIGVKDSTALVNTRGRHLKDFTPSEIDAMRSYNRSDTEQCARLFQRLLPMTPKYELQLIDATIRMLVEPKFELDRPLLEDTLRQEQSRKRESLLSLAGQLGIVGEDDDEIATDVAKTLGSAPKFSQLLTQLGVPVPMKASPSNPDKLIPALAKSDQGLIDLQEHEDPLVSAAAMARLEVKSTLLETRIQKFLEAGDACGGKLPIPTKYYGADTTGRRSGWMYNPLNLPRINAKKPKLTDALRKSMVAPPGHVVVVADLSGIELRMNMFLWCVPYAMELFRASPDKADLYSYFAANDLYYIAQDQVTEEQRQVGKVAHLGLGYGSGASTFIRVAKTMGGIDMDEQTSINTVVAYRGAHPEIAAKDSGGWAKCHEALRYIVAGREYQIDPRGLCVTCAEGIRTPKGMIRYPNLRQEVLKSKREWVYGDGRHKARIYGPKVDENIVQHLSRFVINDAALKVKKETGYLPALEVYDELVYVVPEAIGESHLATVQEIMRQSPDWFPDIVLWSKGDIAQSYGEAK